MAIEVKFLGKPYQNYRLGFASHVFEFQGQVAVKADRDLAIHCSTLMNHEKRPLFEVTGLNGEDPDSDVPEILGVQLEFDSWPSTQP